MAEEKITPEEKLLKIIENPQAQRPLRPAVGAAKAASVAIKDPRSWFNILHIDADISKFLTLQTTNKVMAVICAVITGFFVLDYIIFGNHLNKKYARLEEEAEVADIGAKNISIPEEKFSDVVEMARRRNLFTALPISTGEQQAAAAAPLLAQITNFKLVGILWSENPQAMVEDTQEKKTYLLGSGEQIGQFKINKIFKDKVVLGKDAQEWELR